MRSEGRFKNVFDQSSALRSVENNTFNLFFTWICDMTIFLNYFTFVVFLFFIKDVMTIKAALTNVWV